MSSSQSQTQVVFSFQVEAEALPEISQKFNVVAVPTCILIKVCDARANKEQKVICCCSQSSFAEMAVHIQAAAVPECTGERARFHVCLPVYDSLLPECVLGKILNP